MIFFSDNVALISYVVVLCNNVVWKLVGFFMLEDVVLKFGVMVSNDVTFVICICDGAEQKCGFMVEFDNVMWYDYLICYVAQ